MVLQRHCIGGFVKPAVEGDFMKPPPRFCVTTAIGTLWVGFHGRSTYAVSRPFIAAFIP